MLDSLKRLTSNWIVQLLMVILVIAFSVFFVSGIFTGYRANDIAVVGNIHLTGTEFRRRYDLAMRSLAQQFGGQLTPQQAQQLGLPQQVLSRMVAEATLDDTAHAMGLGLSPDTAGRLIKEDSSLFGPSGKFDRTFFAQIAQEQGLTENQFILEREAEYLRSQLAQALVGEAPVPDALLKAVSEFRGDERTMSYLVLIAPPASAIGDPSDADLTTYFDAHKSDWKAPEYRAIEYFELSPSAIAKPGDVSDADAQKLYDSQKSLYVTPGTRDVQQIVFQDKAAAEEAAKALAGGETFDQLLTQRNLKPADVDLGQVTEDKLADPAVAKVAFSLPEGGVSGVIDGRFGPVIVRVQNIKPAVVKTFDEVKQQLKTEIANKQAASDITAMQNAIEDARAGGAKLPEVAAKYDLKMIKVPAVDSAGKNPDGQAVPDLPSGLVAAAFASNVGMENDPIQPARNTFVWYDVTNVSPAHDRTLAEVHDKVVVAWKDEQRQKKLAAQADDLKAKLDNGEDIAKVAADAGLVVDKAEKLTRTSKPGGALSADAIQAAFDGPKGYIAVVNGASAMTKILLKVDDSIVPPFKADDPALAQIKAQVSSQLTNDLLAAYVTEQQSKINIQLNEAAIKAALGISQSN